MPQGPQPPLPHPRGLKDKGLSHTWAPLCAQGLFEVNDTTEAEKPLHPLVVFFFLTGHSRKLAPFGIIGTASCHSPRPAPPPPRHEGTIYDQDQASAHSTVRLKAAASGKHKSRLTGHHHAAGPGIHGTGAGSALVRLRGSEAGPTLVLASGWDGCGPSTPQHLGAAERLKTLEEGGGGCKQCPLKADIADSGRRACSNRKAEGQSATTVFPATWLWVTLLVARFRRESGDQLCQIVWDWDWAGAKSCCHPLQPQQVMMLGTLTRCLFTPWLDKMWELLKLSLQNM